MNMFSYFVHRETPPEAADPLQFHYGEAVIKQTGDYKGPGVVRGVAILGSGQLRYVVGHTLAGGEGELLHLYSGANLRNA